MLANSKFPAVARLGRHGRETAVIKHRKMKHQSHIKVLFHELEQEGLSPTHSAIAHNIIEYRVRGNLPYHPHHKAEILERIRLATPELVENVERIFKNAGA